MIVKALFTSMLMLACAASYAGSLYRNRAERRLSRARTRLTETLPAGASERALKCRAFVAPSEITTSDTATAQSPNIRTARTRADLQYHKIEVGTFG
jgi:hypothetical protein